MKLSRYFSLAVVAFVSFLFMGCAEIKDVPGGYVAVLLTPTGWDGQIREAGQVDIGRSDAAGRGNTMILIESTSKTIKETFVKENDRDDRIYTKDLKMPLNADLYFNVAVNVDQSGRISDKAIKYILSTITPIDTKDPRVKVIMVDRIYGNLAQMAVRGKTRDLFTAYKDHQEVLGSQAKISKDAEKVVQDIFQASHVPMSVVNVQLSNVKQDKDIVEAQTKQIAANSDSTRIAQVGPVLQKYPEAKILFIVDAIKNAPPGAVILINVGGDEKDANVWAAAKKFAKQ